MSFVPQWVQKARAFARKLFRIRSAEETAFLKQVAKQREKKPKEKRITRAERRKARAQWVADRPRRIASGITARARPKSAFRAVDRKTRHTAEKVFGPISGRQWVRIRRSARAAGESIYTHLGLIHA
jgi:hypothetical protein